jgi:hypothetical protein
MSLLKGANVVRTFSLYLVTLLIAYKIPRKRSPIARDRFPCIWSPFAIGFPRKRSPLAAVSLYSVTQPPRIQSPSPCCFPVFSHRVPRKESPSNPEMLAQPGFPRPLNVFKGFKASKESLNAMEICPKGQKPKTTFSRKQSPFRQPKEFPYPVTFLHFHKSTCTHR